MNVLALFLQQTFQLTGNPAIASPYEKARLLVMAVGELADHFDESVTIVNQWQPYVFLVGLSFPANQLENGRGRYCLEKRR